MQQYAADQSFAGGPSWFLQTFFVLVLSLPLTGPTVCLTAVIVFLVRHARPRAPHDLITPGSLLLVSVAGVGAAGSGYGFGLFESFYFLDPDEFCQSRGLSGDRVVSHDSFPISAQCVVGNATSGGELVPGWINPLIVTGAAVCVAALCGAVVLGVVQWRRRGSAPEPALAG